jgi:predicted GNAT family acetyltransferase
LLPDIGKDEDVQTEVRNNPDRQRYELFVDGALAGIADYERTEDEVVFPHTEISGAMRGRGLGAVLVQGALDDVRGSGVRVVPACWYVAQFIDEHPDYGALVAR